MPGTYWLVTLPRGENDRSVEETFRNLKNSASGLASSHKLQVPELRVGTLDSLMSLSDDLGKYDQAVEVAVRKIERQYLEVCEDKNPAPLNVGSGSAEKYLETFDWVQARYPQRSALPDLVHMIVSGVGGVEEELKTLSGTLLDKQQKLAAATRKKTGNLTVQPMEEILTREVIDAQGLEFHDTDYLKTIVVVLPKASEQEFISTYAQLGENIVNFEDKTGSPAVPNSHKFAYKEGDFVVYTIVMLKGHYTQGYTEENVFYPGEYTSFEADYKAALREKRFTVRDFTPPEGDAAATVGSQIEDMEVDVAATQTRLVNWCKNHYEEAFSAWIHIKVIRAFVESVLRYGLKFSEADIQSSNATQPTSSYDFLLAALQVHKGKDKLLQNTLDSIMNHTSEAEADDDVEFEPYVRLVVDL